MDLDIGRLFSGLDLADRRSLVVAVSGGSDSLSLLFLAHSYLSVYAPHVRLLAVTVDHGLRQEAADEAEEVHQLCQTHGIEHRTLVWRGQKPDTGLIAAAREARYELLAEAAEDVGADVILVGHTMDDQAETVAMRAKRGAGSGLAGMARAMLFDERVWIVRPLLGVRRSALRSWLTQKNLVWIDDPSNENPAYERVRTRKLLERSGEVEEIAREADRAGDERREISNAASRLLQRHAAMVTPGLFHVDIAIFSDVAGDDGPRLLAIRALLATVGGTSFLPDEGRSRELVQLMRNGPARVGLSRVVVERRRDALWLVREQRDVCSSAVSRAGKVWDGRWRVQGQDGQEADRVAAIGQHISRQCTSSSQKPPPNLVEAALSIEPALFDVDNFVGAVDSVEARERGVIARRVVAPYARFLPDFDLSLAGALAALIGAKWPPASPWKHHIEEGP